MAALVAAHGAERGSRLVAQLAGHAVAELDDLAELWRDKGANGPQALVAGPAGRLVIVGAHHGGQLHARGGPQLARARRLVPQGHLVAPLLEPGLELGQLLPERPRLGILRHWPPQHALPPTHTLSASTMQTTHTSMM